MQVQIIFNVKEGPMLGQIQDGVEARTTSFGWFGVIARGHAHAGGTWGVKGKLMLLHHRAAGEKDWVGPQQDAMHIACGSSSGGGGCVRRLCCCCCRVASALLLNGEGHREEEEELAANACGQLDKALDGAGGDACACGGVAQDGALHRGREEHLGEAGGVEEEMMDGLLWLLEDVGGIVPHGIQPLCGGGLEGALGEEPLLRDGHGHIGIAQEHVEGVVGLERKVAVGQGADHRLGGLKDPVLFDARRIDGGLQGVGRRDAVGAHGEGWRCCCPRRLDGGETPSKTRTASWVQGLIACAEGNEALVHEVEAVGVSASWGRIRIEEGAFGRDRVREGLGDAGRGRAIELVVEEIEGVGTAQFAQGRLGADLSHFVCQRCEAEKKKRPSKQSHLPDNVPMGGESA